ncbi:glutamine synthetase [Shimia aestuarii]|uniref:Glutamine synthetase n=1 Tax=Shimia aestuarii TaxID=254406 RepID=A0A1I4JBF1_9RHOB|nr:glutamine synthetase [Shimia aestuarii]
MTSHRDKIANGALARLGLMTPERIDAATALAETVATSDLETIRVLFPDQHGILRGKAITAAALPSILASGMAAPSTLLLKDTSSRTVFPVWSGEAATDADPMRGAGDILLVPDPATFHPLPWAPHSAWLLCDAHFKSGAEIPFASRTVLRRALDQLGAQNLSLTVGLELEFHVLERLDPAPEHADTTMPGQPPRTRPLAPGYQFLTDSLYDMLEPVMDDIRRTAQAMNMPVRSTEVEMGPSQFEVTFEPSDPMTHADTMVMFRTMVKQLCARRGLHATFMTRPRLDNIAASGWHLHQSLTDTTGKNLFTPGDDGRLTPHASAWIAGLLAHAEESCLLTTPTVNGYKRYQPFQLAPDRIQWGQDNRGAMLRALMAPCDPASRIENRVPESAANPHYVMASQILSGLSGLARSLTAPAPCEQPYDPAAPALPKSLAEAIAHFETGTLYRDALGQDFVAYITRIKRAEWDRYVGALSEWEQAEYFSLF